MLSPPKSPPPELPPLLKRPGFAKRDPPEGYPPPKRLPEPKMLAVEVVLVLKENPPEFEDRFPNKLPDAGALNKDSPV